MKLAWNFFLVAATILFGSGLLANSFYTNFTCTSPQYFKALGQVTEVHLRGTIDKIDDTQFEIRSWNGFYRIGHEPEIPYTWGFATGAQNKVANKVNYQPRKYLDHIKFEIDFAQGPSFATTDFIFPGPKLLDFSNRDHMARRSYKFNAFLIMTGVNDHFGTTVP